MREQAKTLKVLHWSLGLLLAVESALFVFSPGEAKAFSHAGMPQGVRLVIGIAELTAAVLFLIPPTVLVGGYSLLAVFALAGLVHIVHGQFNIGTLVGYAIAVLLVLDAREQKPV
jgi:DoxX-like family